MTRMKKKEQSSSKEEASKRKDKIGNNSNGGNLEHESSEKVCDDKSILPYWYKTLPI